MQTRTRKSDAKATAQKTRTRRPGESLTPDEIAAAQETFLAEYAKRGNVGAACDKARIHRSTIYRWMEHDEAFGLAFNQVKADYCDALRSEIHRRASEGWLEPVVSAGQLVTRMRKYSDNLLMFQAKAHMPEYREKVQVSGTIEHSVLPASADMAVLKSLQERFADRPDVLDDIAAAIVAAHSA